MSHAQPLSTRPHETPITQPLLSSRFQSLQLVNSSSIPSGLGSELFLRKSANWLN